MMTFARLGFTLALVFQTASMSSAYAAKSSSGPDPVLEVQIQGHFSKQWTKVYKSGKAWVCKTDLVPYHEIPEIPYDAKALKALRSPTSVTREFPCRDRVAMLDRSNGKTRELHGCADDPGLSPLLERLDRKCGR